MFGVYGIHNNTKDRWYVGQSKDVKQRIATHKYHLKNGSHVCREMQKDYDAGDDFIFVLLETNVSNEKLRANHLDYLENAYINKLCKTSGYNKNTNVVDMQDVININKQDFIVVDANVQEGVKSILPKKGHISALQVWHALNGSGDCFYGMSFREVRPAIAYILEQFGWTYKAAREKGCRTVIRAFWKA